jgi:hypothetical protein
MILPRKGTELGLFRVLIPPAPVATQRRAPTRFRGIRLLADATGLLDRTPFLAILSVQSARSSAG